MKKSKRVLREIHDAIAAYQWECEEGTSDRSNMKLKDDLLDRIWSLSYDYGTSAERLKNNKYWW